jgi:SAM-dependent methyltransferase
VSDDAPGREMTDDALIGDVRRYYTAKVTEHGATPRGVDWNSADGQHRRFERLLRVMDPSAISPSINDYGCGYGGLIGALSSRLSDFSYCGYDVSESMLQAARELHPQRKGRRFVSDRSELAPADYTIASGILNVRLDTPGDAWESYVLRTIADLVAVSRLGVAFNALTSHSDSSHMRSDLYYADPAQLLDYCLRNFSRNVILDHDYELYEFTMIVRLDRRAPAAQFQRG